MSSTKADATSIVVRLAGADFSDWETVRRLILDAFAYMEARIDPPSSALLLTAQSMQTDAAKGALLLAMRDRDLAGCVFVRPKDDALYVYKFAVQPGLLGRGVGRALMAAVRNEATRLGIKTLELQTRIELVENHATSARLGFVKTGEAAHAGFDRPTSITMRAPV